MTTDKNDSANAEQNNDQQSENKADQPVILHNPLDPNDKRTFTLEDAESEQKYKEALTERD